MIRTTPLLLIALILILSSCSGFNCIEGTGNVITEEIDLDLIHSIENNTSIDVELRYGQNQKVEVTGHANHIALLTKEVKSGRWVIDFSENACADDMGIRMTLPTIEAIEVDGSGDITASTPFQGEDFYLLIDGSGDVIIDISAEDVRVDIDGSGSVRLDGYAEDLTINQDGSGDVNAMQMEAKVVSIDNDGSGDVDVQVKDRLEITLKGSGNVNYKGDPKKMDFTEKGSGSINKR